MSHRTSDDSELTLLDLEILEEVQTNPGREGFRLERQLNKILGTSNPIREKASLLESKGLLERVAAKGSSGNGWIITSAGEVAIQERF